MSLILLVSPVFNVEISEAVCYFVILKKTFFFWKTKIIAPISLGCVCLFLPASRRMSHPVLFLRELDNDI